MTSMNCVVCSFVLILILATLPGFTQTSQNSGTTNHLKSVYFVDQNNGWAVGDNGTILKTKNGGEKWVSIVFSEGTGYDYESVFFTTENVGWICGYQKDASWNPIDNILLKTTNGGDTWQRLNYPGNTSILDNIQFINESTGWLTENLKNRSKCNVRKTIDGGITWHTQFEKTMDELRGLHFLDKNHGWLGLHSSIYKTIDGGEHWNAVNNTFLIDAAVTDLFFFNDGVGWVTTGCDFANTDNYGNSWTITDRMKKSIFCSVMFLTGNIGALCERGDGDKLYVTYNGGTSLESIYSGHIFLDLFIVDEQNCWAVGENGKILKFSLNTTGIENPKKGNVVPDKIDLLQNYPNPFNPSTTIKYQLPASTNVTLTIYNLAGQEIETLVNGFQTAGAHEITWQVEGLPSGMYFYQLQAGEFSETRKLILQK